MGAKKRAVKITSKTIFKRRSTKSQQKTSHVKRMKKKMVLSKGLSCPLDADSFRAIPIGLSTGGLRVAALHWKTAAKLGFHRGDRIRIANAKKSIVCVLDTSKSQIAEGQIGLFVESFEAIDATVNETVCVSSYPRPNSVFAIQKKLRGKELTDDEMYSVIESIVNHELTDIEMTYFVSSCYLHELSDKEIVSMTNSMILTGNPINFQEIYPKRPIVDKHCIGGVAGNRTTAVVVPILAAAGFVVPKTSSRSITSPAGTSDTIEVFSHVSLDSSKIKRTVDQVGACLVWGGALDLAPADDDVIKVEHPMSLDPVGLMIASILAKKKSVYATHVLIDIPIGNGAKIQSMQKAKMLKRRFESVGKLLDMDVLVLITDGREPIGNGIGPALEARDILLTLAGSPKGSSQLYEKAVSLAGSFFAYLDEEGVSSKGHVKKGEAYARDLIDSGRAYEKFLKILQSQGFQKTFGVSFKKVFGSRKSNYAKTAVVDAERLSELITVGKYSEDVVADKSGTITAVNNKEISRIAKLLGAPFDKESGVYLHVHYGDFVEKGKPLFTFYSNNKTKLASAKAYAKTEDGVVIR